MIARPARPSEMPRPYRPDLDQMSAALYNVRDDHLRYFNVIGEFHLLVRGPDQPLVAARTQRCLQAFDLPTLPKQTKPILAKRVPYPRGLRLNHLIPRRPARPKVASALVGAGAESARGVSPRAAHRSGLDTLASSGSCHRTKAAAFRRGLELILFPVGPLPASMTCSLCSTGITPLHHYYGAVRP